MTEAAQKQQFLACLGDRSRFSLLSTLAGGPRCVTELAELVGLSQSCTTRHLQALQREGIVHGERRGKRVIFSLGVPGRDPHPVLLWAFGDSASATADPAATTLSRSRDLDAPRPGNPNGGGRPRRASGVHREITAPLGNSVEVTDALIVSHDSEWESNDREPEPVQDAMPASGGFIAPIEQVEAPHVSRAHHADLDDFLL